MSLEIYTKFNNFLNNKIVYKRITLNFLKMIE